MHMLHINQWNKMNDRLRNQTVVFLTFRKSYYKYVFLTQVPMTEWHPPGLMPDNRTT